MKWDILEELPAPVDMDDEMLSSYIDQLKEEIAELEAQQNDDTILNEQYKEDIGAILQTSVLSTIRPVTTSDCPVENVQSGDTSEESSGTNWMLILGIVAA